MDERRGAAQPREGAAPRKGRLNPIRELPMLQLRPLPHSRAKTAPHGYAFLVFKRSGSTRLSGGGGPPRIPGLAWTTVGQSRQKHMIIREDRLSRREA
jgi:hypothetical protein